MIQLREDIVWVRDDSGRLEPFNGERLVASIQAAVTSAGIHDHLLAESMASAIFLYARDTYQATAITTDEIAELVSALCGMIGCGDIARSYEQRRQWAAIQLDQIAGREHFELGFYRQLDSDRAVVDSELERVQLRGLRACVMQLCGARRWGASCRVLADDIVGFVRDRVRQVELATTGLSVEVVE